MGANGFPAEGVTFTQKKLVAVDVGSSNDDGVIWTFRNVSTTESITE
jgi:hypothetical protein